ncbi:hypothetical protein [Blastopirellula marina]|uniref:Uncharacterized protein n=1 Tax=Blastopirellula marina TaxID=124 RepID=A0A2S8GEG9_9BACT|nr:hypothetical protein [Blastopirellula marina]PQO42852.1 hypothetical protein C5Y98_01490 [Blastopirellula marina]PTL46618.1 hypothetical protein C5Y97_01490 [Blastopirellula marina]
MWCPNCQTQVAGIASAKEHATLVCAKCQTRLAADAEKSPRKTATTSASQPLPGLQLDSHRMQATLSRIDRLVQRFGEPAAFEETGHPTASRRPASQPAEDRAPEPIQADNSFPWLATFSLAAGVMLLVCGCFLIVWSVVAQRPDLFSIGFPISVISLACMALAACLYFQDASGKQAETQKWLADVQNQLGGIRQIAADSRHSLGSIPELPTHIASPANNSLAQSEERLKEIRRRLNETRSR